MNEIKLKDLAHFGNIEILAKQVVEGFITGMHKSPFHGFSVEFAEHRLYNKGESTRHIDWKLFARSDKLFTKKYEEETNLRCQIVIDTSSSMFYPATSDFNKLQFSIYAAASLIEMLKKQRDAVGISFFDDNLTLHTAAKSSIAHHRYLYSELEKHLHIHDSKSKRGSNYIQAIHDVAELTHKRSLIILFTDLIGDPSQNTAFFNAIEHLKYNKHEVILFHTLDKKNEQNFELEARPYTLVDMETGEELKVNPAEIRDQYKTAVTEYFTTIENKCIQFGIDFMAVDINEGFEHVLLKYLLRRQKLF